MAGVQHVPSAKVEMVMVGAEVVDRSHQREGRRQQGRAARQRAGASGEQRQGGAEGGVAALDGCRVADGAPCVVASRVARIAAPGRGAG